MRSFIFLAIIAAVSAFSRFAQRKKLELFECLKIIILLFKQAQT
jgi:hypothetical protein